MLSSRPTLGFSVENRKRMKISSWDSYWGFKIAEWQVWHVPWHVALKIRW
jgi:hypothetical protein